MNKLTNSDLTMLANNNFESVLSSVRNSCLNYSINVSPFSATISLKKSIVKDRSGVCIIPAQCENSDIQNDKAILEDELCSLRIKYDKLLSAYASTTDNVTFLQNSIKDRDIIIGDLMAEKKASENIQKELNLYKARFHEELSYNKEEVIKWKQDLDQVMFKHQILEDKYRNLSEKSCRSPLTMEQSELVAMESSSCISVQEDLSDPTTFHDDESACYAEGCCGGLDPAWCTDLKEETQNSNSQVEETSPSFVSHCIASGEPTYPSICYIVSLLPHCVRLLKPGKLSLPNVKKWRTLEARYQEERETCKQS